MLFLSESTVRAVILIRFLEYELKLNETEKVMHYKKITATQETMTKIEKKPFTDDWMFGMVMRDEDICRELLQRILPDEQFGDIRLAAPDGTFCHRACEESRLGGIEESRRISTGVSGLELPVQIQAAMKFDGDSHGVRFDAYIKGENVWTEIEMQVHTDRHLGKRSRYYSANMDIDMLMAGSDYEDLKRSYVIFLCTYDYMKKGEPIYFFERYDKRNQLPFTDESYIIILNTSCDAARVPENLKALYAYINDPKSKMGDALIEKIDDMVDKYNGSEWRRMQMTLEEHIRHEKYVAREDGLRTGRDEGKREVAANLKASGMALAEIVKATGLDVEEIEEL